MTAPQRKSIPFQAAEIMSNDMTDYVDERLQNPIEMEYVHANCNRQEQGQIWRIIINFRV